MVDKIFVREYLESLREKAELDLIFGYLLESMGFQIVSFAKETVGVPQFGRDVVAIGPDQDGKIHKWSFELKGHADKDIDATTFSKKDGINESLLESLNAPFQNNGIPDFNSLPTKFVIVHNGIVKPNFKPVFDGFVKKNFKRNKKFEDWDIHRLTDLFYENLFGEYLFTDNINLRLFKRILVFLAVPEYNFEDLRILLDRIIQQYADAKGDRARDKFLATLNLLAMLIWHYGKENNNLHPSKTALNIIVLRFCHFLLKEKLTNDSRFFDSFYKLLLTHHSLMNEYFDKTLKYVDTKDGFFSRGHITFEPLGQRLFSYDYLDDLLYFLRLSNDLNPKTFKDLKRFEGQKQLLLNLVNQNYDAFTNLIHDRQIIPIIHLVRFFFSFGQFSQADYDFFVNFFQKCLENMVIRRRVKGVWPHAGVSLEPLIEFEASGVKPSRYLDSSSIMVTVLIELIAIFNAEPIYNQIRRALADEVNLQTPYPNISEMPEFEVEFFSGNIDDKYYVKAGIVLPESFGEFRRIILSEPVQEFQFVMDNLGISALRVLAESFFKNDPFPRDWRNVSNYMVFN